MCVKLWNKFIEFIYEKIIKIDIRMTKFYDYTYITSPHIQNKGLPINKFGEEINILKDLNIKKCLEVGSSEGIFSEKLAGICQYLPTISNICGAYSIIIRRNIFVSSWSLVDIFKGNMAKYLHLM